MADSVEETKTKILESAKKEFLENGFTNASLRTIAANAGLTTGAMYRHFKDKDALFCALVDGIIENSSAFVTKAGLEAHTNAPSGGFGEEHFKEEHDMTSAFIDYIYDNFDAFTLLLTKSAGSTHESFLNDMADFYTKNCIETINWLKEKFNVKKEINEMSIHFLATTIINAYAEIIFHKMTKEEASAYLSNIQNFFHFGFMHMLDLPCDVHEH